MTKFIFLVKKIHPIFLLCSENWIFDDSLRLSICGDVLYTCNACMYCILVHHEYYYSILAVENVSLLLWGQGHEGEMHPWQLWLICTYTHMNCMHILYVVHFLHKSTRYSTVEGKLGSLGLEKLERSWGILDSYWIPKK